jgi:non-homologous end joining protein Ku
VATPIWNGNVSFGLLNVPVQLDSGERSVDLHFRLLDSRDPNVVDLMALLKKSSQAEGQQGPRAERAAPAGDRPARSRRHPRAATSENASAGRARPAARKSSSHGRRPH